MKESSLYNINVWFSNILFIFLQRFCSVIRCCTVVLCPGLNSKWFSDFSPIIVNNIIRINLTPISFTNLSELGYCKYQCKRYLPPISLIYYYVINYVWDLAALARKIVLFFDSTVCQFKFWWFVFEICIEEGIMDKYHKYLFWTDISSVICLSLSNIWPTGALTQVHTRRKELFKNWFRYKIRFSLICFKTDKIGMSSQMELSNPANYMYYLIVWRLFLFWWKWISSISHRMFILKFPGERERYIQYCLLF